MLTQCSVRVVMSITVEVRVPSKSTLSWIGLMGRWGDGPQRAPGRASGARRRRAAGLGWWVARCRARRRRVPARAVLHGALRLLRLQHLHRARARRWREPGVVLSLI